MTSLLGNYVRVKESRLGLIERVSKEYCLDYWVYFLLCHIGPVLHSRTTDYVPGQGNKAAFSYYIRIDASCAT